MPESNQRARVTWPGDTKEAHEARLKKDKEEAARAAGLRPEAARPAASVNPTKE